ncbi:thiamine phosphate synthase [Chitinophaga pinensis]|uniref:Thiamine-phosphate synthase n=1 Tax=Chitinophaga pinensis (strain ATCC 43595 / DSM 2588 / LMG 13176 / NBRC 15968 / NCIMB 11800 / UQM 2034) TaxID=485918 RepID=A0A979FZS2_CHIPD|nr:thiamine phosphate synthase [Chitinophaga pinensis]ACU58122.1 thiamine-phosphate pyrophosphorylase [Chitinophaga pinensis DSM 2588]
MISSLHYISQQTAGATHLDNIQEACEAGCRWIQLRIKNEASETILSTAMTAKAICSKYNATLIINDHPDIAKKVGAHGVHVGKLDMTVAEARVLTGETFIIGGTANTLEDILVHVKDGADYVGVGPYRFTRTKEKLSPILGLEGIAGIMQSLKDMGIHIPVIAIGGILAEDIPALMATGIHGIAVSGLITHAANKSQTVSSLTI